MSTLVVTSLRHNSSSSNNVVLDSGGNVGIGTATPAHKLEVAGAAASRVAVTETGSSVTAQIASNTLETIFGSLTNHPVVFRANNTERMRIDASGRVTKPNQPMFYARGAEANYTLTNGAEIPFNNAVFNIGGHYNASTFRFTAPVTGYYFFAYHLFVQTVSNRVSLKVNNNAFNNLQTNVPSGNAGWAGVIYLVANDFVSVGDWQSTTGAMFYMGHSTFSGYLLG